MVVTASYNLHLMLAQNSVTPSSGKATTCAHDERIERFHIAAFPAICCLPCQSDILTFDLIQTRGSYRETRHQYAFGNQVYCNVGWTVLARSSGLPLA
jgi:hypothetical protein